MRQHGHKDNMVHWLTQNEEEREQKITKEDKSKTAGKRRERPPKGGCAWVKMITRADWASLLSSIARPSFPHVVKWCIQVNT